LRIDSAPGRGVTLRLTLPNQPASTLAQQRLSPMYDDGKVAISV
jgi:hypothetical protein